MAFNGSLKPGQSKGATNVLLNSVKISDLQTTEKFENV